MNQTVDSRALLQPIWDELMLLVGEKLQIFAAALENWINTRLQKPLPADWREQLARFLAVWDVKGYEVLPEHIRGLEDWIEAWASLRGVLPAAATVKPQLTVQSLAQPRAPNGESLLGAKSAHQPRPFPRPVEPTGSNSQNELSAPQSSSAPPEKPPSPPANWPKLTPEQIDRIETAAGRRWWYPLVPAGETDWIWLSKLEQGGKAGQLMLLNFYQELADLGRMAKGVSDSESTEVEPLFQQADNVQRAYDLYVKSLIDIETTWKAYLQRVNLLIGVHVIGLKQKIDRGLPLRVDGFHSSLDGQFKVDLRASTEALRVAQGRVEGAYTTLVWVDRAVIAAQFAIPLVSGAKLAFQEGIKRGLTKAAALKVAIAYVVPRAATSAVTGTVVGEVLPRVLQGFGVDEADARAGITIVFSLAALRGAATGSPTRRSTDSRPAQTRKDTTSFRDALSILDDEPWHPKLSRLPQDIAVNPKPPKTSGLARPIGLNEAQYAELQVDIRAAQQMGARDFLVNQHQVNANGIRVGMNRPDLQFTLETGQRVYVEYDAPGSGRALPHLYRIQANDPLGKIILKTVPAE